MSMASSAEPFCEKIQSRRARTGVVGLGYVGLPLAVELAQGRLPRDRHRSRRAEGRRRSSDGRSYIPDVADGRRRRRCTASGLLDATTDFAVVKELDTINICVPTPLRKTKDPDMSYIVSAVEAIAKHLHPGMLVVLESTTYPGHDRRSGAADARGEGAQGRRRLLPRVLARARRSGQPDVPDAQRAEGRRRLHAGLLEARGRALRHGDRDDRAGQLDARRRDGEAAREHVPRGEHRPGQRARADVRPDGHRRLGSRGRGEDEAVRLHGRSIRARASAATAFRSIRSTCRGRRSRPASRRGSSSWPATSTAAMPHYVVDKVGEALNTRRKAVNGSQHPDRRRRLQARHRRHARVAGARRDGAAARRRGAMVSYADPYVPVCTAASGRAATTSRRSTMTPRHARAVRLRRHRHRPQGVRLRRDRRRKRT